ncbi:ComEA family DNA-binding protein [Paenibacillus crassostreae]|uniref:Helix-hairpin-helix DNA-binding motif class 1 domain-containing protein n=1 Tax=Paenibacillus crassostreae TaxID=1763538 RepID=A0A167C1F8_9BACL|nr:helix-hairpin-helix domain-containing protein [Paenibacillus crassostreae]AOZ91761.1 hypothetical protein LPB68_05685 [Paenibacillus crassostreae]OAB72666.1 hypothetical protein PNBC_14565 [Paenibacillus crassostreae]
MRRTYKLLFVLTAFISSGYILLSGIGDREVIQDWEPLNVHVAQALDDDDELIQNTNKSNVSESKSTPEQQIVVEQQSETESKVTNLSESEPMSEPMSESASEAVSKSVLADVPDSNKININTAGVAELMSLPGIGEKKAQAIIDYRNDKGPFRQISDLDQVKGIGVKMLEKIASNVEL